MNPTEVRAAWFALNGRHLPLRVGRDRTYVSPEAFTLLRHVVSDLFTFNVVRADPTLRGLEMRLERDCR